MKNKLFEIFRRSGAMDGSDNNTKTADEGESTDCAEDMDRELFRSENKAAILNAELFSAKSQPTDLSGYVNKENNGGFDSEELKHPSPARRAGVTVIACLIAAVMGFCGAAVGLFVLSASGFTDSNSMLGNLIIDASGLETHKVTVNETELSYSGGFIEVSEKAIPSVVMLKKLVYGEGEKEFEEKGSASGVVISEDGYIITNEHVVDSMDKIRVMTHDGSVYLADIIAYDATTDIAVIKADLPDGVKLTPATFGVSAGIRYGQSVVVIGNPMDVGLTVSTGIISCPDRLMESDGIVKEVFQTNAEMSPGSSGGGVFDIYGNLIGIVCAKTSGTGVEGLGYAVPIDTAKTVANDLMKYGYVKGRPAIGINIASIFDSASYDYYRNGELEGYLFNSRYGVYIRSSLRSTEIKVGDRLIMIEGKRVTSSGMIDEVLKNFKPGDSITLTVERLTPDPDDGNAIETLDIVIELYERDWRG